MKNIKKKITKSYHNVQLKELKEEIGITSEPVYVSKRTKLFIPSIASLASALVLVVVALVLFLTKSPISDDPLLTGPTNDSLSISYLQENTNIYLEEPIQTIYNASSNTIVKIYYGINSNEAGYCHYFLIEYQSENEFSYQADVYAYPSINEGQEGADASFESIVEDNIINYNNSVIIDDLDIRDYQTTMPNIFVSIKIEDGSYFVFIDLEKHYYNLIHKLFE